MRIRIDHTLTLSPLPGTVQIMLHLLLTPGSGPAQAVESWSVEGPGIAQAGRFADAYGNLVHLVNQARPEEDLVLTVGGLVSTTDTNGVLGRPAGEPVPALYRRITALTKKPDFDLPALSGTRIDWLHDLMALVGDQATGTNDQAQMQADGAQSQSQSQSQSAAPVTAVTQTHRFIAAARAMDIPARFVTGYLLGDDEPDNLHSWAEAFDDALGWIGFDPTLQLCPTDRHIRLAVGLDAESAQPLRTVPALEATQSITVTTI